MQRLLITGASGFIGKNALPSLLNKGLEIIGLTLEPQEEDHGISWRECNLLDKQQIEKVFRETSPDILLHLAWVTDSKQFNSNVNFDWFKASIDLLQCFQKYGGKRVIVAGSANEYDWSYGMCSEKLTPLKSNTVYGACKHLLYEYCSLFCKQYELSLAWPRIFFTYGPFESPVRLVPYLITKLLNGEKAEVKSGSLYRDYIYVKDIGAILAMLLDSDFEGAINIGTGQPTKLKDIADYIGRILDREDLLVYHQEVPNPNKMVLADTQLLVNNIGFQSFISFEEGIKETLDFWQAHQ